VSVLIDLSSAVDRNLSPPHSPGARTHDFFRKLCPALVFPLPELAVERPQSGVLGRAADDRSWPAPDLSESPARDVSSAYRTAELLPQGA
jgi:hypothetical protein